MRPLTLLASAAAAGILVAGLFTTLQAANSPANTREQTGGLTGAATASAPASATLTPASTGAATEASTPAPIATQNTTAAATELPTATPVPRATTAAPASATLTLTAATDLTQTVAPALDSATITATHPVTGGAGVSGAVALEGVIEGTVVANRTPSLVLFFADGKTYTLDPLRSAGLMLVRPTSVLNLYNCDAQAGDQQEGCFWDPYLLRKDAFYEVVSGRDAGALVSLVLREAGAPPANQVWIQNRTGRAEDVYYGTQMRPIAPASVEEFAVDSGGVGVFYLRTCVDNDDQPVCEWTAHSAQPGAYYALVEERWEGGPAGTAVVNLELKPILGVEAAAATGSAAQPQTVCRLAVPALNVRSGPGLEFEIVKKVRSSDVEVATVIVTGRTDAGDWLRVDERIATGGWVIAGNEYLTCDGDVAALPVIGEAELPATPTPTPAPFVQAPLVEQPAAGVAVETITTSPAEGAAADSAPVDGSTELTSTGTTTGTTPSIPPGQALLTVQNSFDREMRFTLDQRYRSQLGPSEHDLQPGQSTSLLVYPGVVPFTASSPWQGLSGNDDVHIEDGQAKSLYLFFVYDNDEKRWQLLTSE